MTLFHPPAICRSARSESTASLQIVLFFLTVVGTRPLTSRASPGYSNVFACGNSCRTHIQRSHNLQAYRYGQQKNVFVYRIYSYDTIEAVLYGINQRKMALARMVVDNKARGDGESDMKHNKSCFNFYFRVPSSKNPCKLTEKSNDWDDEIISSVATDLKSGIIDIRQHRTYETLDELSSSEKAEAEDWLRAEVRRKSLKKLAADRKCKEQRQ